MKKSGKFKLRAGGRERVVMEKLLSAFRVWSCCSGSRRTWPQAGKGWRSKLLLNKMSFQLQLQSMVRCEFQMSAVTLILTRLHKEPCSESGCCVWPLLTSCDSSDYSPFFSPCSAIPSNHSTFLHSQFSFSGNFLFLVLIFPCLESFFIFGLPLPWVLLVFSNNIFQLWIIIWLCILLSYHNLDVTAGVPTNSSTPPPSSSSFPSPPSPPPLPPLLLPHNLPSLPPQICPEHLYPSPVGPNDIRSHSQK